ncbi:MAG: division plane positioning ATPase MipZ [Holosporales bacterium]
MSELRRPYVIVLGNEKGGTGKSTAAMHVIVHLLRLGYQVGSIDLDARQGTLSRYFDNRLHTLETKKYNLPMPEHHPLMRSTYENQQDAERDEAARFEEAIKRLAGMDFIVIDTPGSDSFLSRLAHVCADTLITPLNDSFVDLDMLARVNPETGEVIRPSVYAETVWEQRKRRAMKGQAPTEWIVMRNRLSTLYTRNKSVMNDVLQKLAQRIGFKLAAGFSERVIFRELFLKGLTLLDLDDAGIELSLSHIAARQELRDLLSMIKVDDLHEKLKACA